MKYQETSLPTEPILFSNLVSEFGNNLFQYACAHIINLDLKRKLYFGAKSTIWSGKKYTRPRTFKWLHEKNLYKLGIIKDEDILHVPEIEGKITPQHIEENSFLKKYIFSPNPSSFINYPAAPVSPTLRPTWDDKYINSDKTIVLCDYYQDYSIYKPYKDMIKSLYKNMYVDNLSIDSDAVSIHLRGTDCGWPTAPAMYARILESMDSFSAVNIVTNDVNNQSFIQLSNFIKDKYKVPVRFEQGDSISDFRFLLHSNRMITAESTFSWWAAWLSDAKEIHMPYSSLFNRKNRKNLLVDDEKRYTFHAK